MKQIEFFIATAMRALNPTTVSLSSVAVILMKDAYFEEHLEICTLYPFFFQFGYYDWIVSSQSGVHNREKRL
jgi:hypothetical protein